MSEEPERRPKTTRVPPQHVYLEAAMYIRQTGTSFRKAAEKFNINYVTLRRFCGKLSNETNGDGGGGHSGKFTLSFFVITLKKTKKFSIFYSNGIINGISNISITTTNSVTNQVTIATKSTNINSIGTKIGTNDNDTTDATVSSTKTTSINITACTTTRTTAATKFSTNVSTTTNS